MFGSPVLDVAIGLVFVFLLLGLLCTAVNEWLLSYWLKLRSKTLEKALMSLLSNQPYAGKTFFEAFQQHPLVASVRNGIPAPSYLAPSTFTTAILDMATPNIQGEITFADFQTGVQNLPEGEVKKALVALLATAGGDLKKAQANIESWYNALMDRASGWFKRQAQAYAIAIATIVVVGTNADAIEIATKLWQNSALRATVVSMAEKRAAMPRPTATVEYRDENDPLKPDVADNSANALSLDEQQLLGQLLGWKRPIWEEEKPWLELARHLPGWLVGAIAVSLGAPFWFDVLNKLINLRNAGKKPADAEGAKKEAPAA